MKTNKNNVIKKLNKMFKWRLSLNASSLIELQKFMFKSKFLIEKTGAG